MAGSSAQRFDAIVIGAGQGGGPLASAFAGAGNATALIESTHIGGTCINEGCTPTKTMVASARVAALARAAGRYGVQTGPVSIDQATVQQRTQQVVDDFRGGSERRVEQTAGLEWIRGEARFTGPKTLTVALNGGGSRELAAETIVIDTGGRPSVPNLPGLSDVPFLTSTSILQLTETPEHLAVIGAGAIALEFAQMFRRFGSEVTVINRSKALLGREEDRIAKAMTDILTEDGIAIRHETKVRRVTGGDGAVGLMLEADGGTETLRASHLLVAAGRTPNTDALDPRAGGIAVNDRGDIPVNARLETNVAGVYAIGDVNGGPAFTHISYDDYRILRANLIEGGDRTTEGRVLPYCIFTDPELGRVGMTSKDAKQHGIDVQVASMPMSGVARAYEMDETRGVMVGVVERGTGRILGASILGIGGGELMAMVQLAMQGGLTARDLYDGVFAHPTLAESLNNLFAQVVE